MKRVLAIVLAAFTSGCVVNAGKNGDLKIISARLLWKSENIRFQLQDTNLTTSLNIGKSGTDDKALQAVVRAAVKAALEEYSLPLK